MQSPTCDETDAVFDELLAKFWDDRKKRYKKIVKELLKSGEVTRDTSFCICRYRYSGEGMDSLASFDGGVRFPLSIQNPSFTGRRRERFRAYYDMAWLDASIQMYLIKKTY